MSGINKYGLIDRDVASIISVFEENDKIEKVILFGSRAKGNFEPGSDIDLSLVGNELMLNDILDASLKIENLLMPYKFDLVIYDRIKEKTLIEHIDRIGIIIFERNKTNTLK